MAKRLIFMPLTGSTAVLEARPGLTPYSHLNTIVLSVDSELTPVVPPVDAQPGKCPHTSAPPCLQTQRTQTLPRAL